jgi:hypothetical protein
MSSPPMVLPADWPCAPPADEVKHTSKSLTPDPIKYDMKSAQLTCSASHAVDGHTGLKPAVAVHTQRPLERRAALRRLSVYQMQIAICGLERTLSAEATRAAGQCSGYNVGRCCSVTRPLLRALATAAAAEAASDGDGPADADKALLGPATEPSSTAIASPAAAVAVPPRGATADGGRSAVSTPSVSANCAIRSSRAAATPGGAEASAAAAATHARVVSTGMPSARARAARQQRYDINHFIGHSADKHPTHQLMQRRP